MADKSKIEWTDATWNPVTGCTKVSAGCKHCYAETFAERWRGTPEHPYEQGFDLRLWPERLELPLSWKKPRRVFVVSMGDLFHHDVPDEFIDQVFNVMASATADCGKSGRHTHVDECWGGPPHTFQVLTKRPARMYSYLKRLAEMEFPPSNIGLAIEVGQWPLPNVWLGTSVENQQAADERIPLLLQTPAAVRFVSCEPLLGQVDFRKVPGFNLSGSAGHDLVRNFWVICGGESGPNARPMHPDWARSLRDQCQAAGVPFLFKQWGEWKHNSMWSDLPERERARLAEGYPRLSGEFYRVGKKAAGRELDGREWDEYPAQRRGGE